MRPLATLSHLVYIIHANQSHWLQSSKELNIIKQSVNYTTDNVRSDNFRRAATNELHLKGQCLEVFCFWFFSLVSFPPSPKVSHLDRFKFFRKFAEMFACQGAPSVSTTSPVANCRRWQICHWYQRHRRQILLPVSLVLLILVAKHGNNFRLQTP